MPNIQTYNVVPNLPPALEPLREMVFNLWWTWEPSARRLFRHLDPELWDRHESQPGPDAPAFAPGAADRKWRRMRISCAN